MKLKGTGRGGMLTKGDVLVALGKIKNAYGSAEKMYTDPLGPSGRRASEVGHFTVTEKGGMLMIVYIDDTTRSSKEGSTTGCWWITSIDLEGYG